MLKFLKKEIITLKISEDKIDIISSKNEVTSIRREFISLGEDLEKLKKFFRRKNINIILDESIFLKKIFLEAEEVGELNIKKYIEQEILGNLPEEKNFYFSCHFFDKNENCEIFVCEDIFMSTLLEFILKNKLSILNIYISNEEYILKTYEKILKDNKKSNPSKIIIIFILLLLFIFISNYFYKNRLERNLETVKKEYYSKEEIIDSKKKELEEIKSQIIHLEKEKTEKNILHKKFINEVFWIINILPRSCDIKTLYWENGNVTLDGRSKNIEELFKFMSNLEQDKRIEKINFDYILKGNEIYDFILEVKVENGRACFKK